MFTLLLIRHGESVGNQQQRMQGHQAFALSEHGIQQSQKLAQRLAAEFEAPTHVYSSPLHRARQTTDAILQCQPMELTCEYTMAIAEGAAGIFSGLTWNEAKQHYPHLCHTLETHVDWTPIPGGESPAAIRQRAHNWWHTILTEHQNGDRIWVVTHEWFLCQLVSVLLGSDRTWQFAADHTALFEFRLDLDRWPKRQPNTVYNNTLWQIRRFNDTQHLR